MLTGPMKTAPVFYDVSFYAKRPGFNPPAQAHGLRRVSSNTKWLFFSAMGVIMALMLFEQYSLAFSQQATQALAGNASFTTSTGMYFLQSLAGPLLAVPLVLLILWSTRRTFVQPVVTYFAYFLTGASFTLAAAYLLSMFVDPLYSGLIAKTGADPLGFAATVHAPIFEELTKGVGLLIVVAVFRNYFRTVHDYVIAGMLIGFGFAFTENIQYFIMHGTDAQGFWQLVLMRVTASILTHAVFTAATGLLLGWFAIHYGGRRWKMTLGWFLGYVFAVSTHALWNGSSSVSFFVIAYLFLFLPLFVTVTYLLSSTGKQYDSQYLETLSRYADRGWLVRGSYEHLFPKASRKKALRKMTSAERRYARRYASWLSELAHVRWALDSSRWTERLEAREKEILVGLFLEQKRKLTEGSDNPQEKTAN